VGISIGCSQCYAAAGEYGADNCKVKCLEGWCKEDCLSCTSSAQSTAATCSGHPNPLVKPCMTESLVIETMGACTSDDLSKINALPSDTSAASFGGVSATCGQESYSIFSGKFDSDKFNSCLASKVGISTGCSQCYAVAGEYGADNCKVKCLEGWCKEDCLSCTSSAQATAATCSGHPNPPVKPCMTESLVIKETTGACTSDDLSKINALPSDTSVASFGGVSATCGREAYSIFSGKFDSDKFNSCLASKVGISIGCSQCYAAAGEYGADNCKVKCLEGWCKEDCLSCTSSAQSTAATCSGHPNPLVKPCMTESLVIETMGACTSDDLSKINALPSDTSAASFGGVSATCGQESYSIFSGKFDSDKFNSCLASKVGISTGCSQCYAVAGEYGADNCKVKCLEGWCKEDCLSCTSSAQATAAACSGHPNPPVKPCMLITIV